MLTALLIATYSLSFRGGNANDLVTAFVKDTKEKIVVPADIYALPSFYIEYDKPEERNESFCRKVSLEEIKGLKNVFAPTALPSSYLENYSSFMPPEDQALSADSKSCIETKDGKWRLKLSPNGYFKMADLETLKLSKPVKVHWLVKTMFVAGDSGWLAEKDLLQTLASCSFGSVKETEKQYEIELDPKRFKAAAVNWASRNALFAQNRKQYAYFELVKWNLTAEAFKLCTEAQIKLGFASPTSYERVVVVSGSSLDKIVRELVRAFYFPRPEERMTALDPKYLELIDTSKSVKVQIEPKKICHAVFPCVDNGELHL